MLKAINILKIANIRRAVCILKNINALKTANMNVFYKSIHIANVLNDRLFKNFCNSLIVRKGG